MGSVLVFIPNINKILNKRLIMTISGIILLLITILDILPENLFNILKYNNIIYPIIIFILGIITITILDKQINENNIYSRVGILNFIAILLHNIPEGIATFITSLYNYNLGIKLGITILIHNIPEGLLIMLPHSINHKKRRGLLLSLIASISEPIGGILFYILFKNNLNELTINYILIYVSGLMITLGINNIVSSKNL